MLLTSSVDGTSLPVPGARRRLKLLALLSLPLYPPCFPGKPVGPIGGRQHQIQGLLPRGPAGLLTPTSPTPHKGTSLLRCSPFPDVISSSSSMPSGKRGVKRESSPHLTDKKTESGVSRLHVGACSMAEPDWNQGSLTPIYGHKRAEPSRNCG